MVQSDSSGIPLPKEEMPDWLLPLRNAFLASLLSRGLKTGTVRTYAPAVDWLCAEAGRRGLTTPDGVDESVLAQVREPLPLRLSVRSRRKWASVLGRFIAWLVKENVVAAAPQAPEPEQTALGALLTDYGDWLRTRCGLVPGTIRSARSGRVNAGPAASWPRCSGSAIRHPATWTPSPVPTSSRISGRPANRAVSAQARRPSRCDRCSGSCQGQAARRQARPQQGPRRFATGRTERNLVSCVPRVSGPRSPAPTRHLSLEEVERVLAAAKGDGAVARRDHAMLLAMARLGLRGQEVIAIRLDDIDWEAGEILVRGKCGRQAAMPLPVDVGEAVVEWIRHGRRGSSRHLFVSVRPPFMPFTSADSVRTALRRAHAASGVTPPGGEVRCHVFRHSLAMALLQDGMPLADIGNMLRHGSAETTTVYARHDIEALRPLARPWPVPPPVEETRP